MSEIHTIETAINNSERMKALEKLLEKLVAETIMMHQQLRYLNSGTGLK